MRLVLRFRIFIIISLAVLLISAACRVQRATCGAALRPDIRMRYSRKLAADRPPGRDRIDRCGDPGFHALGVSVYDEKNKVPLFNFKEAFVELDVIASIMHSDLIVDDIGLVGTDLSIERLTEKEWLVQGISIHQRRFQ